MRGAPHKGLAWLMRRMRSRISAATSGLPGRCRDFLVQYQAKALRCQRTTVSGPHDLQAGAPTRPAARQQDPQASVGALQAQARWRVLVEHGQLVTKGENLSLQGSTDPKTGGEESEKSKKNRVHRGCNHHPTNDGNLCVFKSGGVFGTHRPVMPGLYLPFAQRLFSDHDEVGRVGSLRPSRF